MPQYSMQKRSLAGGAEEGLKRERQSADDSTDSDEGVLALGGGGAGGGSASAAAARSLLRLASNELLCSEARKNQLAALETALGLDEKSQPRLGRDAAAMPARLFQRTDGNNQLVWVSQARKRVVKTSKYPMELAVLYQVFIQIHHAALECRRAFSPGDLDARRQLLVEVKQRFLDLIQRMSTLLGDPLAELTQDVHSKTDLQTLFRCVNNKVKCFLADQNRYVKHDARVQRAVWQVGKGPLSKFMVKIDHVEVYKKGIERVVVHAATYPLLMTRRMLAAMPPLGDVELHQYLVSLLEETGRLALDIYPANFGWDDRGKLHLLDTDAVPLLSAAWAKEIGLPEVRKTDDEVEGYESDDSSHDKKDMVHSHGATWAPCVSNMLFHPDLGYRLSGSWLRLAIATIIHAEGSPPVAMVRDLLGLETVEAIQERFQFPDCQGKKSNGQLDVKRFFALKDAHLPAAAGGGAAAACEQGLTA